jgi:hypothetical protein
MKNMMGRTALHFLCALKNPELLSSLIQTRKDLHFSPEVIFLSIMFQLHILYFHFYIGKKILFAVVLWNECQLS